MGDNNGFCSMLMFLIAIGASVNLPFFMLCTLLSEMKTDMKAKLKFRWPWKKTTRGE